MLFLTCVLSLICSISGINNGQIVSRYEVPYVVGLELKDFSLSQTKTCTGGIIHEHFILTAAHCFTKNLCDSGGLRPQKYEHYKVNVYANTDSMIKKSKNAIKRKGTDVYFMKQFFADSIDDIAILKLDCKLDEGTIILELPPMNNDYSDRYAVIVGYGCDPGNDEINKQAKLSLKTMNAKIVESARCLKFYKERAVAEKHLCMIAVDSFSDKGHYYPLATCSGDSGAPIVYQGSIVIGVVHWGTSDNSRYIPELNMRVSHYVDFINTIKNEQPIDPNNIVHYELTRNCNSKCQIL